MLSKLEKCYPCACTRALSSEPINNFHSNKNDIEVSSIIHHVINPTETPIELTQEITSSSSTVKISSTHHSRSTVYNFIKKE